MTTPTTSEKYLSQMLEGYESGIEGVDNFIKETTSSLEKAKEQKQEMLDSIVEIKLELGLENEAKGKEAEA
tara:strand:+ start:289 stop:501 length:213 start_codon:yes stop_codon:yes gene_type:complete